MSGGGTIYNAGTISSAGASAILFSGGGANTLILSTGSHLIGAPVGSTAAGATNTLVLQGSGLADNWFQNFSALKVQASGTWTLDGTSKFGAGTISGGTLGVGDSSHLSAHLIVSGTLVNQGVLAVAAGEVDVGGAVTGSGSASIGAGAALRLSSTFNQNVAFAGANAVLQLAKSQIYGGVVSGFAVSDELVARDMVFISGTTKATFTDNGSHTGGVLTVTDGTHAAHIHLTGDFTGATFTVGSDGAGGVAVTDTTAGSAARPAPVHPIIAAMASMDGSGGGGHSTPSPESGRSASLLLAAAHPGGRSFG
jgi:hypothetical protein